ncbi:MAG: SH3 domain-containing protein [Candidatus Eisenbacteria bacterium]
MRWRRICVMLPAGIALALAVAWAGGEMLSVQVKSGQLRSTPSFLGAVTATLGYGDRVTLVQKQDPWLQVRDAAGRTGWIHQSALTKKRIVMSAGEGDAQKSVSGEELALAGKGFNSDVEAEFKAQNANIDFTWVDRMETINVTPEQSALFLAEGKVEPAGGGAR